MGGPDGTMSGFFLTVFLTAWESAGLEKIVVKSKLKPRSHLTWITVPTMLA